MCASVCYTAMHCLHDDDAAFHDVIFCDACVSA